MSSPQVCSARGNCTTRDVCVCPSGWGGSNCSIPTCNNILATSPSVCTGLGKCISNNTCVCNSGVTGTYCTTVTITGTEATGRMYSDGTYARSCRDYYSPSVAGYTYSGATGTGTYWLNLMQLPSR